MLSLTLIIIIITTVASLSANGNAEWYSKLLFNPYQVVHRKEWYRIFSHAFIHDNGNLMHLIFNMYVLYSFGNNLETLLNYHMPGSGLVYYLIVYIGGIATATIPAIVRHKDNYAYNSVGASGAVSAVLFANIALMPFSGGIGILFIPFTLPPLVFGVLYLAYEIYMDKRNVGRVAHDAHIWGAVYGFLCALFTIPGAFSNFFSQLFTVFGI